MNVIRNRKLMLKRQETERRVLMVVPGETAMDQQHRMKGSLDVPLSAQGEQQARQAATELSRHRIDVICTAPCLAAQQTARELARRGEARVRVEPLLENLNHGLWSGKAISEVKQTQPKIYRQWQEHPETVALPDGETIDQAKRRAEEFAKWLHKRLRRGQVAVVVCEPMASIVRNVLDPRVPIGNWWDLECRAGTWEWLEAASKTGTYRL